MKRRDFICQASSLATASALWPRDNLQAMETNDWHSAMRPLMGTFVEVAIYGYSATQARQLSDELFSYLELEIAKISDWDQGSDAGKLRQARTLSVSDISPEFATLVNASLTIANLTKGMFAPLCKELSELWREARQASSIPSKLDLRHAISSLNSSKVELSADQISLNGNCSFDFGGIGKGYIADIARKFLNSRGVKFARVACSGDIAFLGPTEWVVEIEHPRRETLLGAIVLNGHCAISTSGDYRESWQVNGRKYHHLIDPASGLPGDNCEQVTVVHPMGVFADALATAAFFMKPEQALKLIELIPGAQALVVDKKNQVHRTKGFNFNAQPQQTQAAS